MLSKSNLLDKIQELSQENILLNKQILELKLEGFKRHGLIVSLQSEIEELKKSNSKAYLIISDTIIDNELAQESVI